MVEHRRMEAQSTYGPSDFPAWCMLRALARCKWGTAPSLDGIMDSLFKDLPWELRGHLLQAMRKQWLGCGRPVPAWYDHLLIALFKGGDPTQLQRWRFLTLASNFLKLWESALLALPDSKVEVPPWIIGFEPGHQVADVTECIRLTALRAKVWKSPLIILQMDVETAFDSMRHADAAVVLAGSMPNGLTLHNITSLLVDHRACATMAGVTTDWIPIKRGVGQGRRITPWFGNRMLWRALEEARHSWFDNGWWFELPGASSQTVTDRTDSWFQCWWNVLTWADNIFVLTDSWDHAELIMDSVSVAMDKVV